MPVSSNLKIYFTAVGLLALWVFAAGVLLSSAMLGIVTAQSIRISQMQS